MAFDGVQFDLKEALKPLGLAENKLTELAGQIAEHSVFQEVSPENLQRSITEAVRKHLNVEQFKTRANKKKFGIAAIEEQLAKFDAVAEAAPQVKVTEARAGFGPTDIPKAIRSEALNVISKEELEGLYKQIGEHATMRHADPAFIEAVMKQAIEQHKYVINAGEKMPLSFSAVENIFKGTPASVVRSFTSRVAPKPSASPTSSIGGSGYYSSYGGASPTSETRIASWEELTTTGKVNTALLWAGSALCLAGFLSAARNSVVEDEQGNKHVSYSNVGMAILQGTLAVGSGWLALESTRVPVHTL